MEGRALSRIQGNGLAPFTGHVITTWLLVEIWWATSHKAWTRRRGSVYASASTPVSKYPIRTACHTAHAKITALMPSTGVCASRQRSVQVKRLASVGGSNETVTQIDARTAAYRVAAWTWTSLEAFLRGFSQHPPSSVTNLWAYSLQSQSNLVTSSSSTQARSAIQTMNAS